MVAQQVVHAEARGSGYEGHLLAPLLEATRLTFATVEAGKDVFERVKVTADSRQQTADSGFHSKNVDREGRLPPRSMAESSVNCTGLLRQASGR